MQSTRSSALMISSARDIPAPNRMNGEKKSNEGDARQSPDGADSSAVANNSGKTFAIFDNPTKLDIVFTWASQILAILIGVLFGVYTILSYYATANALSAANQANDLSQQAISSSSLANQVALLALCQALLQQSSTGRSSAAAGGASDTVGQVCTGLLQAADVSQLVSQAFPDVALPSPSPSPLSTTSISTATISPTTNGSTTIASTLLSLSTLVPTANTVGASSSPRSSIPQTTSTGSPTGSAGVGSSSPPSTAGSGPHLDSGQIGAIVGSILGAVAFAVVLLSYFRFREKLRSQAVDGGRSKAHRHD